MTSKAACRERARQARANRLAHADQQLDGDGDKENSAYLTQQQRPLYSLLGPADASLVEKLLVQVYTTTSMLGSSFPTVTGVTATLAVAWPVHVGHIHQAKAWPTALCETR